MLKTRAKAINEPVPPIRRPGVGKRLRLKKEVEDIGWIAKMPKVKPGSLSGRTKTGQYGKEGQKMRRPQGRPKKSRNRMPRVVKELILNSMEKAGGEEFVSDAMRLHPDEALRLLGKMVPREVEVKGNVGTPRTLADLAEMNEYFEDKKAK